MHFQVNVVKKCSLCQSAGESLDGGGTAPSSLRRSKVSGARAHFNVSGIMRMHSVYVHYTKIVIYMLHSIYRYVMLDMQREHDLCKLKILLKYVELHTICSGTYVCESLHIHL